MVHVGLVWCRVGELSKHPQLGYGRILGVGCNHGQLIRK